MSKINRFVPSAFALTLVSAMLFWRPFDVSFESNWIYRSLLLFSLLLAIFSYRIGRLFSHTMGWGFAYFSGMGLIYSSIPFLPPIRSIIEKIPPVYYVSGSIDETVRHLGQTLHYSAALNLLFFIMIPVTLGIRWANVTAWFKREFYSVFVGAFWVVTIASFFSWPDARLPNLRETYFLHNPSVTGTFIAIILSSMSDPLAWIVGVVALTQLGATTPLVCLLAGVFVRFVILSTNKRINLYGWLGSIALAIPAVYIGMNRYAHGGNGRFETWRLVCSWVETLPDVYKIFGVGMGSTPVLVPLLQISHGATPDLPLFFLQMHNDWLQIFFEFGVVGMVMAFLMYLDLCTVAARDKKWSAMIAAYGAAMLTNFPMHSPLFTLLGIVLVGGAYLEKNIHVESRRFSYLHFLGSLVSRFHVRSSD